MAPKKTSDEPTVDVAPSADADQVEAPAEPVRVFRLRDAVAADDEGVHRVSVGANPRVSLAAGETFETSDRRLARRLAANEHLEEVTASWPSS